MSRSINSSLNNNTADDFLHQARAYVPPTCSVLAAVGFFMGGQARLVPLFSGNKRPVTKQDNSDDALIPLLSRFGLEFSTSTADAIIGTLKIALAVGVFYLPTRRPAARWGLGYLSLGLISRLHEGVSPVPALINMALLAVPAQLIDV